MTLRYDSDLRKNSTFKFFTLRQQSKKGGSASNIALADFIAPKETNIDDYIGTFCVSTVLDVMKKQSL